MQIIQAAIPGYLWVILIAAIVLPNIILGMALLVFKSKDPEANAPGWDIR
jgi:hypothetical protein